MKTLIQRILNLGSSITCWKSTSHRVVSQAQPSGLPRLGGDEHTHTFEVVCTRALTRSRLLM
jgi:hypothetical protein